MAKKRFSYVILRKCSKCSISDSDCIIPHDSSISMVFSSAKKASLYLEQVYNHNKPAVAHCVLGSNILKIQLHADSFGIFYQYDYIICKRLIN